MAREPFDIPLSRHPIDSVNLADPKLGLVARIDEIVGRSGLAKGRVDISLGPAERVTAGAYFRHCRGRARRRQAPAARRGSKSPRTHDGIGASSSSFLVSTGSEWNHRRAYARSDY